MGPFVTPLEEYETLPGPLLDFVALMAYGEATGDRQAEIVSEKQLDASVTYAAPSVPLYKRRATALLEPYLKHTGTSL